MPNEISISSIAIAEPNVPLRSIHGYADFSVKNFVIWNEENDDECQPVSVDLTSSKRIHVLITVVSKTGFEPGRKSKLSGKFIGSEEEDLSFGDTTFSADGKTNSLVVSVYLNGYSHKIPWGVADLINWEVDGNIVTTTPIELYAIAPADILPPYLANEIPVELLRIFVLPTIKYKVTNYVDYAVTLCHQSAFIDGVPFEPKAGSYTPVHSYKYENVNGGPSFAGGQLHGRYDLNSWLANRIDDAAHRNRVGDHKRIATVNCYDQAGIVILTVSLGITDSSQRLQWYFMNKFGYIHANLIGWGDCNNPFFGDTVIDEDTGVRKYSGEKITSKSDDKTRSKFGNHAFVVLTTGNEMKVLDACAGPHTGADSLKNYIATAINHKGLPPDGDEVTGTLENAHGYQGIEALGEPIHKYIHYSSVKEETETFLENLHAASHIEESTDADTLSVNFSNLAKILTEGFPQKRFSEPRVTHSPQKTAFPWTKLLWTSLSRIGETITIEVEVHSRFYDAVTAWDSYFLCVNHPEQHLKKFARPQQGTEKGNHHLIGSHTVMWIYGKTFVKVSRADSDHKQDSELSSVADAVHKFMSNNTVDAGMKQDLGEINAEASYSKPTVGSEFYITVTAPKSGTITAILENNRVLQIEQKPTNLGSGKLRFRYRALTAGVEVISFICSHWETCEVSVKEFKFWVLSNNPIPGKFSTYDVRHSSDLMAPGEMATKFIKLDTPYHAPPGIPMGFRSFDIPNKTPYTRVRCFGTDKDKDGFKINVESWGDSSIKSAECSWLQIASDDTDFQFGSYQYIADKRKKPWDGPEVTSNSKITFKWPYEAPPKVVVFLSGFSLEKNKRWRLKTYASNITATSFKIHIETWGDSRIAGAQATWIAYPADKKNVISGSFNTAAPDPNDPGVAGGRIGSSRGNEIFGNTFDSIPRTFLALDMFDADCSEDLKVSVSSLGWPDRISWEICTWLGGILYAAGASYIALG